MSFRNPMEWGLRPPVAYSKDLDRILKLPRRPSDYDHISPPGITASLSAELRRPGGVRELRTIQAAALVDARSVRGLLGPIGVGAGKTDISVLLPTVLGSRVAVLLVPPALKKKLLDVEYPFLQTQWRLPNLAGSGVVHLDTSCTLHVVAYSQLSTAKGTDILDRIKPDLIVADEVHALAGKSARRKRFDRYMKANPETIFCGMSGTITSKSIKDYAHLAKYALRHGSPLPLHWPTLDEWSAVIDPQRDEMEHPPGELVRLCQPGESVRSAFGRRLIETPGIVATRANHIPTALTIHERPLKAPANVTELLADLRSTWVSPSGEELTDALSVARYARQMAAGLYTRWVWPRAATEELKDEWLACRREWHRELRQMLKGDAKKGMDSPLLLWNAAREGRWKSEAFAPWNDVVVEFARTTGKSMPATESVWVSDFMVDDAVKWGKQPGIIWYEHDDLGRKIAERGGFPHYGPTAEAPTGIDPKTGENVPGITLEKGDRTIVASIRAWGEGWNLQSYCRMLFTSTPTSAKLMEQALGRCHRPGQLADEVEAWIYLHTAEMRDAWETTLEGAVYAEETMGGKQKVLMATKSFTNKR